MSNAGSSALIPAAGLGTRLGMGPKALLQIDGRTLLDILLDTLSPVVDEIVVAAPEGYAGDMASVIAGRALCIPGGDSRQASIERLLQASSGEYLLIQDAARPFCSGDLCRAVLQAARERGAAGAFLDPTVPVGLLQDGEVARYLSRSEAGIFQAPQAFRRDILETARAGAAGREFQSTAQMVIQAGYPLAAVPGEAHNIKITSSLDWEIAQSVIAPRLWPR
ncbi:MAG: 2-C-methyl-D-erythritol 4-phosphate cytidylyltransferase [Halioglobus sp.]|nr:2-C-methyl-D-erythritol 4-phosphate cytidylyltransferase [Halioglobus sp.]